MTQNNFNTWSTETGEDIIDKPRSLIQTSPNTNKENATADVFLENFFQVFFFIFLRLPHFKVNKAESQKWNIQDIQEVPWNWSSGCFDF